MRYRIIRYALLSGFRRNDGTPIHQKFINYQLRFQAESLIIFPGNKRP